MTKRSLPIVIFSIVFTTFAAQHSGLAALQAEDRIKSGLPSVYITLERTGKRKPLEQGESDEGVWLRLHNNTRWPLTLAMNDVPKEYGDAALFYDVLSDGKVVTERTCHACSSNQIRPGGSLLFSVPREDLSERGSIRVSFSYAWERAHDVFAGREPQHFVYFYSSKLPRK
jgi:hypothetical protein